MATFYDHFSGHAPAYAAHRPSYPAELFTFLAAKSPGRSLALDVATGSGQAAAALAGHFARVLGVDASEAQLAAAERREGVAYRLARAEALPVEDGACDLVTVAQALHWLNLDTFYPEARRALRPGGVIAAWCYALSRVSEEVDAIVDHLYGDIVGPYWPERRRHVEVGYADLAFPFDEIEPPRFEMRCSWTSAQFCAYLRTWSAVKLFESDTGRDPVREVEGEIERAWGNVGGDVGGDGCDVVWPLFLRVGAV